MSTGGTAVHKDPEAAKIGMWLFLFTEMLLFGGLFILYAVYRSRNVADFHRGGRELNADQRHQHRHPADEQSDDGHSLAALARRKKALAWRSSA
jgi:heme/copper-type cytochrome/quinol oxidase subunit 3